MRTTIAPLPAEDCLGGGCHKAVALLRTPIGDRAAQDEYLDPTEYSDRYQTFRDVFRMNRELGRRAVAGEDGALVVRWLCGDLCIHLTELLQLLS
jgi:hypothetical protein